VQFVYVPATRLCRAGDHLTTAIPAESLTRALKRTEHVEYWKPSIWAWTCSSAAARARPPSTPPLLL